MGFIDHQVVEPGQEAASDLGVGQQQRVVDHHDVRDLRLRARPVHVAILFRAVDADAVERVGCDARPEDLFPAMQAEL